MLLTPELKEWLEAFTRYTRQCAMLRMEPDYDQWTKDLLSKLLTAAPDVREKVTDEIRKQMDLMCGICVTNDLPKPLDLAKVASNNIHALYAPLILAAEQKGREEVIKWVESQPKSECMECVTPYTFSLWDWDKFKLSLKGVTNESV